MILKALVVSAISIAPAATIDQFVTDIRKFCNVPTKDALDKEPQRSCLDFMINCALVLPGDIKNDLIDSCKTTWNNNKEAIIKSYQKED